VLVENKLMSADSSCGSNEDEIQRVMKINLGRRTRLVRQIADALISLCRRNDNLVNPLVPKSRYHSQSIPDIQLQQYLGRLAQYTRCSEESLILCLIYIDKCIEIERLKPIDRKLQIDSHSVHRVLLIALISAIKYFDDAYFSLKHYSTIGGVDVGELTELELDFLFRIQFDLFVPKSQFEAYVAVLAKRDEGGVPKVSRGQEDGAKHGGNSNSIEQRITLQPTLSTSPARDRTMTKPRRISS
jgi:hypothetical protein